MSRFGDSDCDNNYYFLWPSVIQRGIQGKRGQAFLTELVDALDALPTKELITGDLVLEGNCCALGAVALSRGTDVSWVDPLDHRGVAKALGTLYTVANEVAYQNDEMGHVDETPAQRWVRVRKWAVEQIELAAVKGGAA